MATSITEKDGIHKAWYETANEMTMEKLPDFLKELTEEYHHDYGTICHAIAAAAIAAAYAVNKSPCSGGGITGFQAGCIMWAFITHWMSWEDKSLAMLDYENLLYPQYHKKFTTISKDTWEWLQKKAQENLDERDDFACLEVKQHWQSIIDGNIPFGLKLGDDN